MDKENVKLPVITRYLLPSFDNVLWIAVFITVMMRGWRMINADGDLPLHLAQGRYILNFESIPLQDFFSHTQYGMTVVQHKWLGQAIFALVDRFFSLNGVVILSALVITSAFWLVFKHVTGEERNLFSTLSVLMLAIVTSMVHWLSRPHLFTFLFLAAWMILLRQMRKGNLKVWWLLPVSMVFWVNLHGGFIAGLVTWIFFGLGNLWDCVWRRMPDEGFDPNRFWRYYLLGGTTAFGATLINPSGIGLWQMLFRHLGNRYLAAITFEFQSPNFHEFSFWPFLFLIGLLIFVIGLSPKKVSAGDIFNSTVWMFFGLYSARNIPLFAIVVAPLIAQGLDDLLVNASTRFNVIMRLNEIDQRLNKVDRQLSGLVWPLVTLAVVIVSLSQGYKFDYQNRGYRFDPEVFPVMAVDWLEENAQDGEMFNEFLWGGYLQYRIWPEKLVFIDSNVDTYGEAIVREYLQVVNLEEGWGEVLDQYDVTWAILPPESRAAVEFQMELGWVVIYEDDTVVILRIKNP